MKPSTARSKGRETENSWIEYLKTWGLANVERRRLMGSKDEGDVSGWPGVCTEVKSGASLNLGQWLRELDAEMVNSNSRTGYVTVRPKGRPDPADWYVVLRPAVFMRLMLDAGWLPAQTGTEREV